MPCEVLILVLWIHIYYSQTVPKTGVELSPRPVIMDNIKYTMFSLECE